MQARTETRDLKVGSVKVSCVASIWLGKKANTSGAQSKLKVADDNKDLFLQSEVVDKGGMPASLMKTIALIPDQLCWACSSQEAPLANSDLPKPTSNVTYFQTESTLTYEHFFADFGPLNLGQIARFCSLGEQRIADPQIHE